MGSNRKRGLRAGLRPLIPNEAQHKKATRSNAIMDVVQQTSALWFKHTRTRHSYVWLKPESAPTCQTSSLDTPAIFTLGDGTSPPTCNISLPWLIHPNADKIEIEFVFALINGGSLFQVGIRTVELLTGASAANTGFLDVPWSAPMLPFGMWKRSQEPWLFVRKQLQIKPNIPANRSLSIEGRGQWTTTSGNDPFNVTHQRRAKIAAARIRDIITAPLP